MALRVTTSNSIFGWSFLLVVLSPLSISEFQIAAAHIFIDTPNVIMKDIGSYRVIFLPYPGTPLPDDNSTQLNFSIQQNGTDVIGVFVSLKIQDKKTNNTIEEIPYKFHEFGDVTFPYTFRNEGNYIVTLLSKINGDPTYGDKPLLADFELFVGNPKQNIGFDEVIIYITPGLIIIAGVAIYLRRKNKI